MDPVWLSEEVRLFNLVFYPRQLPSRFSPRTIRRMPRGKARQDRQKLLAKHEALAFAEEWDALEHLLSSKP